MESVDVEEYADVFAALADESRLELLLAICQQAIPQGPVRFSEAMAAGGFEDSGRFTYHLDRLRENFVYSSDGAYLPTTAAWELFVALRSGRLADNDLDVRRADLDATCLGCGRPLVAEYQYQFYVWCPDCERGHFSYPVGPDVAADADLQQVAHDVDRADRAQTRCLLEYGCPRCAGSGRVWFSDDRAFAPLRTVAAVAGCTNCGHGVRSRTVGAATLCLPEVQDYCEERRIDLQERPQWAYHWARTETSTVVRSRDPWTIEQYAHVDGCRLRAVLREDGSVEAIDHVRVDGRSDEPPART